MYSAQNRAQTFESRNLSSQPSEPFLACREALVKNRSLFAVSSNQMAVLYAGSSSGVEIYKKIQRLQKRRFENLGLKNLLFVMVTDVLAGMRVVIAKKEMGLRDAMFNKGLFIRDEYDQLWEEASLLFSRANKNPIVWRGTIAPERNPILDAFELPVQILNGNKLSSRTEKAIVDAMKKADKKPKKDGKAGDEEPGKDVRGQRRGQAAEFCGGPARKDASKVQGPRGPPGDQEAAELTQIPWTFS